MTHSAESVPTRAEVLASLDWLLRVHDSDPSQRHLSVVIRHIAAQDQRLDDLRADPPPQPGDGPQYHADLQFWQERQTNRTHPQTSVTPPDMGHHP